MILWDFSQERSSQFLIIFGNPHAFRCTCVSWPRLKEYVVFFLSLLLSTLHLLTKGHEFSTAGLKSFERLSFRKTGSGVYQTLVFDARGTTLADVHRFCVNSCSRENCCDGFILNQNVLDGGQRRSHSLGADVASFHYSNTQITGRQNQLFEL